MSGIRPVKQIGFIGLGDMGLPMACNLVKEGFDVKGFDLRSDRLELLKKEGGAEVKSVEEIGKSSDAVFVMVMTGQQVKDITLGNDGLLKSMKPGTAIILTSTISPSEAREVAAPIIQSGIELIDSPVSGGQSGAEAGTLTMMAASTQKTFNEYQDVL